MRTVPNYEPVGISLPRPHPKPLVSCSFVPLLGSVLVRHLRSGIPQTACSIGSLLRSVLARHSRFGVSRTRSRSRDLDSIRRFHPKTPVG